MLTQLTLKGATFEIVSGGRLCPLYDDPDGNDSAEPLVAIKYIEAVTGAPFEVRVTFDARFNYHGSDAVRVYMRFDGCPTCHFLDVKRVDATMVPSRRQIAKMSHTTRYSADTRQWHRSMFIFGKLEIKDSSGSSLSTDEIKGLGKIQIWYQRICYVGQREKPIDQTFERISEVSEKVLKGKSIENTIETVPSNVVTARPSDTYYQGKPISGEAGKTVQLEVLYRSKRALQMLGCVPRSPSPEPDIQPTITPQTLDSVAVKEELTALRARLAELERRANNTPEPKLESENKRAISAIKREMGDMEIRRPVKRSRRLGPIETIDLTDD